MTHRRIVFVVFEAPAARPHRPARGVSWRGRRLRLRGRAGRGRSGRAAGAARACEHGVADPGPAGIDTLVVVGGGRAPARQDEALVSWISCCGGRCPARGLGAREGSAGGGGAAWTVPDSPTHWAREEQLAGSIPRLGWTASRSSSGNGRCGRRAAAHGRSPRSPWWRTTWAGGCVLWWPGSCSCAWGGRPSLLFSVALWSRQPAAVSAIHADPGARHDIAGAPPRTPGLSRRHLERRFTAELGVPPAAYVERVRVEAAQRALTEGRRTGRGHRPPLRASPPS
ncbi:Transcriptional regulator GlxA family with amidase domain OS=Streptomyces violarus OX=67380 GN=FHS41_000663 PE=4 SV=1 [Streptomyces violarus]